MENNKNYFIEEIQNTFFVDGTVIECDFGLAYKLYIKNQQIKDDRGSYKALHKNSIITLCNVDFKMHSLVFIEMLMVYEVILINNEPSRRAEVNSTIVTVYEEIESVDTAIGGSPVLKPVFNVYSKKDCYKVLEHIYNMRTGLENARETNFVSKHKITIGFLDCLITNTYEAKYK